MRIRCGNCQVFKSELLVRPFNLLIVPGVQIDIIAIWLYDIYENNLVIKHLIIFLNLKKYLD